MMQNINLANLPEWVKLEVTKGDLIAFAQSLINQTTMKVSTTSSPVKEILTLEEAAEYLNLAKQTLYGMTSKNEIVFFKRSRKIYFQQSDLEKYLLDGRRKTKDEIAADADAHIQQQKIRRAKR
jgi:excisionase family DNA binding protein